MLIHVCDASPHGIRCAKPALFRATYDPQQKPVEVCRDDLAWPAELAVMSGDGTLRVETIEGAA